eukprot:10882413-Alexandrium_andersonii.AAC.1
MAAHGLGKMCSCIRGATSQAWQAHVAAAPDARRAELLSVELSLKAGIVEEMEENSAITSWSRG